MNKALIDCHVCGKHVARSASTCPACGVQTRAYHAQLVGSVGLVSAFALGWVGVKVSDFGDPDRGAIFIWLAAACAFGGVGYWLWRRFL